MILNHEAIKSRGILSETIEDNYNNAVYDIRIGKIITIKGDEKEEYEIPPQGMIVVISKEHLIMPSDIVGYAHVRTGLSSKGIMAINIGIIDPGYSGKLASTLLNFGKESYKVKTGDKFLRTTFHSLQSVTINKLSTLKSMDDLTYIINKKFESTKYMDEKFLSLDTEVENSITRRLDFIAKYVSSLSALIASIALGLTFAAFIMNYFVSSFRENPKEGYEYELKVNKMKYEMLDSNNKMLKNQIDSILHILNTTVQAKDRNRSTDIKSNRANTLRQ